MLISNYPTLLAEFDYEANSGINPCETHVKDGQKIWWKCDVFFDHRWQSSMHSRVHQKSKCPFCVGQKASFSNCVATTNPEVLEFWDHEENEITPFDVTRSSNKKIKWKCDKADDHKWEARTVSVLRGIATNNIGCPCCKGYKVVRSNCFATMRPDLLDEWDYDKNEFTPFDVTPHSDKRVFWKCRINSDHTWEVQVKNRTNGSNCPYCVNKKIDDSNCLETTHPDMISRWDFDRNKGLTPKDVPARTPRKVWWKCDVESDHRYKAAIYNIAILNHGCSCCSGHQVVNSNCLLTTHPELSEEWDWERNGDFKPTNVSAGSGIKVWWKCSKEKTHYWHASIGSRTSRNRGCPCCRKSKGENKIKYFLDSKQIPYSEEYKIPKCKNILPLPFDFAIFNEEGFLIGLIEYQGIQHYEPIDAWKGSEGLRKIQLRDAIKKKFCHENNIRFLEIKYDQCDQVENLISGFLTL